MVKKKNAIKPFAELAKMYGRYEEFFENAVTVAIRGFVFVLSVAVILFVLFATGLLVF